MEVALVPILEKLREIYDLSSPIERYNSYVKLMTIDAGEIYPLGDFSPMGQRQRKYLDELIQMRAEAVAREACYQAAKYLESNFSCRVMLVVLDEPKNGWTQRFLTDAKWKFDALPSTRASKGGLPEDVRPWVPVDLWTTDDDCKYRSPTAEYIEGQIRESLFRAQWKLENGLPKTLRNVVQQESAAIKFSGRNFDLDSHVMSNIKQKIEASYETSHFPTIFALMYGDEAANSVGYDALGVPCRAGFAFASRA